MARILEKRLIRQPDVFQYKIAAPLISRKARPGQFVIIRLHEKGERIPLSLADIDPANSTISLIVMAVGKTTTELSNFSEGDAILDLCGPLGMPTDISAVGRVVLVGGGFGVAPLYPIARAFKAAGNVVTVIMGARSGDLLIYEQEMLQVSDRVLVTTDDGSKGVKGLVTTALRQELASRGGDLVMAVGPAIMMKTVSEATLPFGIRTTVSLNPIMIDGTGMCGGCRVLVSGKSQFACVDGPEFNAHDVNFDVLIQRNRMYREAEKRSLEEYLQANREKCATEEPSACLVSGGQS